MTIVSDVVVAGFGGSGAAAAITAADLGGEVLILEKQAEDSHLPSTAALAGGAMLVTDIAAATSYLDACAMGLTPHAVNHAWATKAADLGDWINALDPAHYRLGVAKPSAEHPHIEGAKAIVTASGLRVRADGAVEPGTGTDLFAALSSAVRSRPIGVRFGARAVSLRQSADGRVTGIDFEVGGNRQTAHARRGVILATGGYGFNDRLKEQFLPVRPTYFYGGRAGTGDGIVLAQAVGAALWHMNLMMGRGVGHFCTAEGCDVDVILLLSAHPGSTTEAGYVVTDGDGARFANEQTQAELGHAFYFSMLAFDPERARFARVPSYWFLDRRRIATGPLTMTGYGSAGRLGYRWSHDNQAEIDAGWIASGLTVEAAAAAAGVADPARAAQSVREYNRACSRGSDPFGRPVETLVPLDQPPYYCVPLWPGGTSTIGGPRRNELGQIEHALGPAISGLYGAGENGSNMGPLYPGQAAYYSDVLCSGRIAGEAVMTGAEHVDVPDADPDEQAPPRPFGDHR
jgi:succinate dehydrogenase/fumarate reductase flavoprotein subunit